MGLSLNILKNAQLGMLINPLKNMVGRPVMFFAFQSTLLKSSKDKSPRWSFHSLSRHVVVTDRPTKSLPICCQQTCNKSKIFTLSALIILSKDLLDFFCLSLRRQVILASNTYCLILLIMKFVSHTGEKKNKNKLQALKRQAGFSTSRWVYRPYVQPSSGIFQSWKCQAFIWFICKALTIIGTLWSDYLLK